jgi:nucleoside-diphosphate kinase
MERTLIIFKPDSVQRGIVGEILARFEKVGFKIVGLKMVKVDHDHLHKHYEEIGGLKTRKGDDIFNNTLVSMQEGPVIAMVVEGVEAVESVRKMVGVTEPKSALPGTIRGDYAHVSYSQGNKSGKSIANIVHASADPDEAKQEIAHWFNDSELFSYSTTHESFTQPK